MAYNTEKSVAQLFKKYMNAIIAIVLLLVFSIFILLFMSFRNGYKDSMIVNVLGRQRMLTQMMAKNADRIYKIHDILKSDSKDAGKKAEYDEKLKITREELVKSREEYNREYETIKKGYINTDKGEISFKDAMEKLNPYLVHNEKIWVEFRSSIDILLSESDNTPLLVEALKYINENNGLLLKSNEDITDIIVKVTEEKGTMIMTLSTAVVIFALLLLIILFAIVYRFLFTPINQLYKGMAEMGITRFDIETPEVKDRELVPVFGEVKSVFDKLNSLILLIENLNKNTSFSETLSYIYNSFSSYIPYTYIGVALIEEDQETIRASYGITSGYHEGLPKKLLGYKTHIKNTSLGKIIETGQERVINDLEEYLKGKALSEYNKALMEEGIRASITFPLKKNDKTAGIIFFSSNTKDVYGREHIEFLRTLANSIVLSIEKNIFIDDMIIGSIQALARLAEQRDPETGEHIQRMKTYSRFIAEVLHEHDKYKDIIDIDYIKDIERFSPLHDIGKVGIRDDILLKPGRLTREEFEIMKTHTIYGAYVLKVADENIQKRGRSIFKIGIEIAEGHHEKWDGTGYPHGRAGQDIPLSARIVAAADVFDALTSKRPYKEPFSFEESCKLIVDGSGKHFDPDVSNIFIEHEDRIRDIYNSFKSSGML